MKLLFYGTNMLPRRQAKGVKLLKKKGGQDEIVF